MRTQWNGPHPVLSTEPGVARAPDTYWHNFLFSLRSCVNLPQSNNWERYRHLETCLFLFHESGKISSHKFLHGSHTAWKRILFDQLVESLYYLGFPHKLDSSRSSPSQNILMTTGLGEFGSLAVWLSSKTPDSDCTVAGITYSHIDDGLLGRQVRNCGWTDVDLLPLLEKQP